MKVKYFLSGILFIFCVSVSAFAQKKNNTIHIVSSVKNNNRIDYGIQRLQQYFKQSGYVINNQSSFAKTADAATTIYIDTGAAGIQKQGFRLAKNNTTITITGADASGVLYGCLELTEVHKKNKGFPQVLNITDAPEMVLRGACVGLQKPYYLPGRQVYEYPYTPEVFPWLYDKALWLQYLDSLVDNRMNSLYLWNGHPFASLVKLKDYPYAVEVDEATFKKNEEIFDFLTTEADKRGIWVIQMFYNIIVSKPFAEHHKIKTQERERPIIPLIADYTRKSIAAFVEKYANVGLMVCLGEAMEGVGPDDIEWFTKTIIPGVQDGLKALGKTEEPPIVLRAHDTDAPAVMRAALPLYKNLYTEAKFNGEALTYERPRGSWAELHQTLSKLGSVHIQNVHILANLEPFRYGAPEFIQNSVIGMHEVMGGNGLHLYPQASYWDWPYSADSVKGKRLLQIERDWIWYKAWSRYAWKAKRDSATEQLYWSTLLADKFGCSIADGRRILNAYNETGYIAPKLLRRVGITDGNRQTLTLGMLMTQLINPYRYGLFTLLYDGESPEGEMIIDYVDKSSKTIPHTGETPVHVADQAKKHGADAAAMIRTVTPRITKNKDEFKRLANDVYSYQAMANYFSAKIYAAIKALKYKYTNDIKYLEWAAADLKKSVAHYETLTRFTRGSYLYANSMQTQQRKIPMRGANASFIHWKEMLPVFKNELLIFQHKIDSLKKAGKQPEKIRQPLAQHTVQWLPGNNATYTIAKGAKIFADTNFVIKDVAGELKGLQGVQLPFKHQLRNNTMLSFETEQPVKILVGYFKTQRAAFTTDTVFLNAPELEANATADDYGQAEAKITNAIAIEGLPAVNIHEYNFKKGKNTLHLSRGVCLVLAVIDGQQPIPVYDANLTGDARNKNIDWLFE